MSANVLSLPTLALNVRDVVRLLRAASYAQILQSTTRVEWKPDEGGIQNVYGALLGLFGTPGTSEVVFPDMGRADDEVRRRTARRVDVFFDKCAIGPGQAGEYLNTMDDIRRASLDALRETIADQTAINRDIARAWGVGIEYLATVELASTVVVKVGGALLGPLAGWVDFGFDVAVSTLPDLGNSSKGKAVAFEVAEVGFEKANEKIVDAINKRSTEAELQQAMRRLSEAERKLHSTVSKIAERRQTMASGFGTHKTKESLRVLEPRVARYGDNLNTAQKGVVKSTAVRGAAKGLSFVFLANDILDAFEEYNETVDAARR